MARRQLNRDGRESSRNLARKFRPPRMIDMPDGTQKFHPLDMMKYGKRPDGSDKLMNTTGVFGTVSTWGMSRISIVVRRGAPGRQRGPRKKKKVSRLYCGFVAMDFDKASFEQLRNLRANILTAKLLGDYSGVRIVEDSIVSIAKHIENYLTRTHPDEMESIRASDKARVDSCKGMVKSKKISIANIKSLNGRVERGLYLMKMSDKEIEDSNISI